MPVWEWECLLTVDISHPPIIELLPGMEVVLFRMPTSLVARGLFGTGGPTEDAGRLGFSSGCVILAPGAEFGAVEGQRVFQ